MPMKKTGQSQRMKKVAKTSVVEELVEEVKSKPIKDVLEIDSRPILDVAVNFNEEDEDYIAEIV